jgi:adenosylcobinamide-GDP ribazoletransferase
LLTIVPAPAVAIYPVAAGRAAALFPLVGALLGLLIGGIGLMLDRFLPHGPTAALLLAAGAILTGGLHLDGLMDTADGLAGGRSPERRLAIMRDSRVGAAGAIAGILAILTQFACLGELSGWNRLLALVAALSISRWAMLAALATYPPARPDGLGATFHAGATLPVAVVGTLLTVVVALLARPFGPFALAAAILTTLALGHALARRLGGLSGDCYGAVAVVTETAALAVAVAVAPS